MHRKTVKIQETLRISNMTLRNAPAILKTFLSFGETNSMSIRWNESITVAKVACCVILIEQVPLDKRWDGF